MKRKKVNLLLLFGAIVLCILLMIWLFLGTTLEEDGDPVVNPALMEQSS